MYMIRRQFEKEFVHMESAVVAKLRLSTRQFFNENYKSLDNHRLQSFFDEKNKNKKMKIDF